jgi:hypothetical protein
MITGRIKLDLIPFDNLCGHKINVLHSQCHLYQNQSFLQTRPDDVVAEISESKGFGKSNHTPKGKQKLAPIWIGYRYQIQKERLSSGESGQRQRQSAGWWRRGHWRRVAVGKRGENLRDWRWIEPTWCEPN